MRPESLTIVLPAYNDEALLRSLRARFGEHLIVVLDNFSPHKKTELQARRCGMRH